MLEYLLLPVSSVLYNLTFRLLSKLPVSIDFLWRPQGNFLLCFSMMILYAHEICGLFFPEWRIWAVTEYGVLICFVKNMNSFSWLQISFLNSFTPYSSGNVTFSLLAPGPNHRPGYNDFYNTQSLQEFVKATQVRLHFHGQYYTTEPPASLKHRYYAASEVTITGR